MTAMTLPVVAALRFGPGRPWFAAHSHIDAATAVGDETDVLWLPSPYLLDWTQRWATDEEVNTPHLTLTEATIAQLLYVSNLDVGMPVDDQQAVHTVLAEVERCGCNPDPVICQVAQDAGDHPQECQDRMRRCFALAARLLEAAR